MKTELYTTEELNLEAIDARNEMARGYFPRGNSWKLAEIREELAKRGESLESTTVTKYDGVC